MHHYSVIVQLISVTVTARAKQYWLCCKGDLAKSTCARQRQSFERMQILLG
jgi:hypothetical protein